MIIRPAATCFLTNVKRKSVLDLLCRRFVLERYPVCVYNKLCLSTSSHSLQKVSSVNIFDRTTKRLQKDCAAVATNSSDFDYVREEVCTLITFRDSLDFIISIIVFEF